METVGLKKVFPWRKYVLLLIYLSDLSCCTIEIQCLDPNPYLNPNPYFNFNSDRIWQKVSDTFGIGFGTDLGPQHWFQAYSFLVLSF
jgi:hypothetical protein